MKYFYFVPGVSVCLFVCRFVFCLLACLSVRVRFCKTTRPNLGKFAVRVTCGRGLILLWRRWDTLCTSGYMDDIMWKIFT